MLVKTDASVADAYSRIRKYKRHLTRQETRTLIGQIKAGAVDAAMIGLDKMLARKGV